MVTQFSLKERIAIANGPILKHSNLWSSLHPTPSLHVLSGHISFPFHPAGSFFIYSLKLHICSPALWLCPVTSPTFPKYLSSILITWESPGKLEMPSPWHKPDQWNQNLFGTKIFFTDPRDIPAWPQGPWSSLNVHWYWRTISAVYININKTNDKMFGAEFMWGWYRR